MHAVALGNGLEINVVVRRLVIQIQQVVVQIADAALGANPVQAHLLKGQIGHNRIDIMGQGLIHLQENVLPRDHVGGLCQMG